MRSIRTKIILLFSLLLGILLVAYFTVSRMSLRNIYDLTEKSVQKSMEQFILDTQKALNGARDVAYQAAQDMEVQISLRQDLPASEREMYKQRRDFNYKLAYMSKLDTALDGIYVLGENGALYRASKYGCALSKKEYRGEEWYQEVLQTNEELWLEPHKGSRVVRNLDRETISLVIPIRDRISYGSLGVVVADVGILNVQGLAKGEGLFEGELFLLNGQDQIIYRGDAEETTKPKIEEINRALRASSYSEGQGLWELKIQGEDYLVYASALGIGDWTMMSLISRDGVFSNVRKMQNMLIAAIVLSTVLSLLFAFLIAHWISVPLKKVESAMQLVEKGNYQVQIADNRKDEVGALINGFNEMTRRIGEMTKNEQENQKALLRAELNALQAQINPHFLYNTLDSINWMVRMGRNDEVGEMIDSLILLFRISLSKGQTFISIGDELTHVEKYLQIQKIRYSRILNYQMEVPEELHDCQTIKMILQPLVENAIYDGLKEKGELGFITITARAEGEEILFCVCDTGMGIREEKLQEIRQMMLEGIEYHPDSYGVISVQKRLQTYFGKQYGLQFESEYGKGTTVSLRIPRMYSAEGLEYGTPAKEMEKGDVYGC